MFYLDNKPAFISFIAFIFYFYPPFTFSLIFAQITAKAGAHYDSVAFRWVPGEQYEWGDLFKEVKGTIAGGISFTDPSPIFSLFMQQVSLLFYISLTWYFDHIVSSNRGRTERFYFCFTKNYWNTCKKTKGQSKGGRKKGSKASAALYDISTVDSVKEEEDRVAQLIRDEVPAKGLRMQGIEKVYQKYPFGIKSK